MDLKPLVGWPLDVARDGSFQALVVVRDYQLTPLSPRGFRASGKGLGRSPRSLCVCSLHPEDLTKAAISHRRDNQDTWLVARPSTLTFS